MPPEGEKMESRERLTALRLRLEISQPRSRTSCWRRFWRMQSSMRWPTRGGTVARRTEGTVLELAMLRYRRRGMEGETVHSEGGLQMSMEGLPAALEKLLNRYRKARAV